MIPGFLGPGKYLTRRSIGVVGGGGRRADFGLGHAGFEIFIGHPSRESPLSIRSAHVEWECTVTFMGLEGTAGVRGDGCRDRARVSRCRNHEDGREGAVGVGGDWNLLSGLDIRAGAGAMGGKEPGSPQLMRTWRFLTERSVSDNSLVSGAGQQVPPAPQSERRTVLLFMVCRAF